MATTITFYPTSRTPESIAFRLSNDGVVDGAPLVLLKANLLAALMEGPLKEIINRTANLTALHFAGNGAKADFVRINHLAGGFLVQTAPPTDRVECLFVATGLSYAIWSDGGDGGVASSMLLELRLVHSNER
jgi:hypothetical protein